MSKHYEQVLDYVQRSYKNVASQLDNAQQLAVEIDQKAKDSTLHIMLYGAYNAGKSTLINAIMGNNVAAVNDIPTTDNIDTYAWQGMTLLDTPGVNAPIAHADITEKQLNRCSVILFVIREGDMDSQDVYDRLMDLIKRDKKIFIVLNHQFGSDEEKAKAKNHIREVLLKKGLVQQIDAAEFESVSIIPINLRTALKGRLQGHQKLVEHSGFTEFENGFDSWLTTQNQEKRKFDSFKNLVDETWYQPALSAIQSKMKGAEAEKIQLLRQQQMSLENQRSLMINDMRGVIQSQVIGQKSRLIDALQQGQDEHSVRLALEKIILDINKNIESSLQTKFDQVVLHLSKNNTNNLSVPVKSESNEKNVLLEQSVIIAKKAVGSQEGLKQALLLGRSLKIPILKGRWEKTLGQWAGRAAVVIQVATAIYDAHAAQKEQDKQNDAQKNYTLQLYQTVEEICGDINKDAYELVKDVVTNFFAPKINDIQHDLGQIESVRSKKDNDFSSLNDMQSQMLSIEW